MRRILLTGLFLLLPAAAHAQAQGGPAAPPADANAPKPGDTTPAAAPPAAAPPAAAPPAADAKPAEPTAPHEEKSVNLGINPTGPAGPLGTASVQEEKPTHAAPPAPTWATGKKPSDESAWKFDYHGYLRAPMRMGINKALPEDTNGYSVSGSKVRLHEATVPDDQYLSFQSTAHNMRSWAEAFFSYGNQLAKGVVGFGSYNLTEGGFNDTDANWGISQAYVLLTPDLGFENVRLWAKAGAIVDRYGMSGRYDAGEYDMYMFGRTHVTGETAHIDYDITPSWTLYFEQGFGSHKPDPNTYNNARYTMLHHEHIGLKKGRDLEFGAHYLMSWSQEEYRTTASTDDAFTAVAFDQSGKAPRNGLPPGHLWVAGVEARAELGAFGYIYGAYSHVGADYALTVSRAIEVLHASGGGEFDLGVASNYLDSPNCHNALPGSNKKANAVPGAPENWWPLDADGCSDGNGSLNAIHAQYEFSLTNFNQQIKGGQRFWGAGFDAILKLYGMAVFVNSQARDTTKAPKTGGSTALQTDATLPTHYTITKSKFGADLTVQALPWLSPGIRFDRVMPNSEISQQSFSILSPRLQFKSQWVTHERITLGYSHYFYDQRVCEPRIPNPKGPGSIGGTVSDTDNPMGAYYCTQAPPSAVPYDGFGASTAKQDAGNRAPSVTRPDENVVKIEATMWW
jgi:hypothetical protein